MFDVLCERFDQLYEDVESKPIKPDIGIFTIHYVLEFNSDIQLYPRQCGLTTFIDNHSTDDDLVIRGYPNTHIPENAKRSNVATVRQIKQRHRGMFKGLNRKIDVIWLDRVDINEIIDILQQYPNIINGHTKIFGGRS